MKIEKLKNAFKVDNKTMTNIARFVLADILNLGYFGSSFVLTSTNISPGEAHAIIPTLLTISVILGFSFFSIVAKKESSW